MGEGCQRKDAAAKSAGQEALRLVRVLQPRRARHALRMRRRDCDAPLRRAIPGERPRPRAWQARWRNRGREWFSSVITLRVNGEIEVVRVQAIPEPVEELDWH